MKKIIISLLIIFTSCAFGVTRNAPYPNPNFAHTEVVVPSGQDLSAHFNLIHINDLTNGILIDPAYNLRRIQLDIASINQALATSNITATFVTAPLEKDMTLSFTGTSAAMVRGEYIVPVRAKNITQVWGAPQNITLNIIPHAYPTLTIDSILPYIEGDTATVQTIATGTSGAVDEVFDPDNAVTIATTGSTSFALSHFGLQALSTFTSGDKDVTINLSPLPGGVKNAIDTGQNYDITLTNVANKSVTKSFQLDIATDQEYLRCPNVVDSVDVNGYVYAHTQHASPAVTYHFVSTTPISPLARFDVITLPTLTSIQQYFSGSQLLQCFITVYDVTAGIPLANKAFSSSEAIPPSPYTGAMFPKTGSDTCIPTTSGTASFEECRLKFTP
jgi:hypothetical protein